jgi:2C-methyl-D-erythritol 2,4-cyclodiphosphate synthase
LAKRRVKALKAANGKLMPQKDMPKGWARMASSCVNVKAKTAEKMGPVGLGQAIEARAIVLLYVS